MMDEDRWMADENRRLDRLEKTIRDLRADLTQVAQERDNLRRVLDTDCEICESPIALMTRDGVWRLQCQSGCPPYAEGLTISRTVNDWDNRHDMEPNNE